MVRRPPDLGGEPVATVAQASTRREKQRLTDGDDLGIEALLRRLAQKVAKSGGIMLPVTICAPASLKALI